VRLYGRQVVWWATPIEAVSSLERLSRQGDLSTKDRTQAFARLNYLRERWNEIQPVDEVRDLAERLLRVHKLRAADALQLAAALVWCSNQPRGRHFIGADDRLAEAAEIEGFNVIRLL
jgi:predicted nucleic acid-binding protein